MAKAPVIALNIARQKLAKIWFPLSSVLFLLFVVQSLTGAYGSAESAAFGWLLPNFLPTLALMVSVFAANALMVEEEGQPMVRLFFFRMSFWASIFYFVVLFLVILTPVVMQLGGDGAATADVRLDMMERSNIFLGPLQSLVVGMMGVLFIAKKKEETGGKTP